jgi:hypothetical protein
MTRFDPGNNSVTIGTGNPDTMSISALALDGNSILFLPALSPAVMAALAAALAALALFKLR